MLVDDHSVVREGLKLILEMTGKYRVVGECGTSDELLRSSPKESPDLMISDLKMPGTPILEKLPLYKEMNPKTKVIIFTAYEEEEEIQQALALGVDGFLKKDTPPEEILHTVGTVMMGYACFKPRLFSTKKREDDLSRILTEREMEIFQCIVMNESNVAIAEKLYISEATVKTHISSILRKLGQPNRSQAVLYAVKEGLIKVNSK